MIYHLGPNRSVFLKSLGGGPTFVPTTAWSLGRLFKISRPRMRCKMTAEKRPSDSLCSQDSFIITFSIRTVASPNMQVRVYDVSCMFYFSNCFPSGTEFKSYN